MQSPAMIQYDAIKCYMNVRPRGPVDALRLYSSFPISILVKLLARGRFQSLGFYIPGRSFLTISIAGVQAHVRPRTNDIAIMASTTEPKTAGWFRVRQGDIVVDVGAHIGRYSLLAAQQASKVIAVEPEPSNFEMLLSNIKLNRFTNIIALPIAMSARPGRLHMFLGEKGNLGTWSTSPHSYTRTSKAGAEEDFEVECDTLDRIVQRLDLKRIDWLKIDAEGHELSILTGAEDTLKRTRRVILEVADANEKECKAFVDRKGLRVLASEKGGGPTSNWLLEHL